MSSIRFSARKGLAAAAAVAALGLTAFAAIPGASAAPAAAFTFTFSLVPSSAAISACLPHASGSATITQGSVNDTMKVTLTGMPAGTGFDLFVIQQPTAPFGVAWYQ